MDIFADLVAEQDRLEAILDSLDDEAWSAPSGALGWTVADVVLHLAQTEEAVVNSVAGRVGISNWRDQAENLDDAIDQMVSAERTTPGATFERWRVARREAVAALMGADAEQRFQWAATPLKPKTLATTRLAEHWAHGLDITRPLGLPFPDTDRLRHIAWLGHGSLLYAFNFVGQEPHAVFCELTAPDGSLWRYGPADADSTITGAAGAFCRVGARRLAPDESGLVARGPHGMAALRVLRNYAG
ncbi:MAG: maleylpyruvate isomerase family mycothiol-dependent enzyme [Acidimicrobiales bacterium]